MQNKTNTYELKILRTKKYAPFFKKWAENNLVLAETVRTVSIY